MAVPRSIPRWHWAAAATFLLLLAGIAWAFQPGLGGALIFDDLPNLLPWKQIGDIDTLQDVLAFATSSVYFPGRPLSLLSFLIDDQSWQPAISTLKRTNLALHLLNACLVFWLALTLLRHLLPDSDDARRAAFALLVMAIWSLHPLQVSNVSYVIQRMNLLATTLVLGGLVLFVHGRELLAHRPRAGLIACSAAAGLLMPLAVLAKENGLLLCLFALLIEGFCFRQPVPRWWRAWKFLALWLPLLAFVAYSLVKYRFFLAPYGTRDFNAWERLLTQGPVVLDYLNNLLLPRLMGSGLFHDNFPVYRSLLDPVPLLAWLVIAMLLGGAWVLRRRLPLLSFGIFFYFGGHVMESTLLPLELYFEHRNYLPQLGLWLGLVALVDSARGPRLRKALVPALAVLVVLLGWMTRQNASLWAQPALQAAVWYQDNPGSLRTLLSHANWLVKQRRAEEAMAVLDRGSLDHADTLIVLLSQKYVRCYLQDLPTDFSGLARQARNARYETASLEMLALMWKTAEQATPAAAAPHCRYATQAEIAAIYENILANPRFASARVRGQLHANLAAYAQRKRDLNLAMHHYDKAFAYEPNPLYAFEQAAALLSAGLPEPAGEFILKARQSLTVRMRLQYPAMEANLDRLERARQKVLSQRGAR